MFIALSVCLLAAPGTCKIEEIHDVGEPGPPMACIVQGQASVASWQDAHPEWRVKTWKCVPPGWHGTF